VKVIGRRQRAAAGRVWVDCSCGLALAMFVASSAPAAGKRDLTMSSSGARRNETLDITLRVYNYAHLTPALLSRSEGVASSIFGAAGLTIRWVDCPISAGEMDQYPKCHKVPGPSDFVLRFLPQAMAETSNSSGDVLGSARACPPGGRGCSAYVYPSRLAGLAVGGLWEYQVLGHVIAHEVGHLLLGANSHSATGIMRAFWQPEDFRRMATGYLLFNPEERDRMQTELQSRAAQKFALAAGEPNSQ
jgi:hypothetical protein